MIEALLALLLIAPAPAAAPHAGYYDGGQMEVAAGLELGADGHFRYGLSYGALDEEAEGRWSGDGDALRLMPQAFRTNHPEGDSFPAVALPRDGDGYRLDRHGLQLRFVRR